MKKIISIGIFCEALPALGLGTGNFKSEHYFVRGRPMTDDNAFKDHPQTIAWYKELSKILEGSQEKKEELVCKTVADALKKQASPPRRRAKIFVGQLLQDFAPHNPNRGRLFATLFLKAITDGEPNKLLSEIDRTSRPMNEKLHSDIENELYDNFLGALPMVLDRVSPEQRRAIVVGLVQWDFAPANPNRGRLFETIFRQANSELKQLLVTEVHRVSGDQKDSTENIVGYFCALLQNSSHLFSAIYLEADQKTREALRKVGESGDGLKNYADAIEQKANKDFLPEQMVFLEMLNQDQKKSDGKSQKAKAERPGGTGKRNTLKVPDGSSKEEKQNKVSKLREIFEGVFESDGKERSRPSVQLTVEDIQKLRGNYRRSILQTKQPLPRRPMEHTVGRNAFGSTNFTSDNDYSYQASYLVLDIVPKPRHDRAGEAEKSVQEKYSRLFNVLGSARQLDEKDFESAKQFSEKFVSYKKQLNNKESLKEADLKKLEREKANLYLENRSLAIKAWQAAKFDWGEAKKMYSGDESHRPVLHVIRALEETISDEFREAFESDYVNLTEAACVQMSNEAMFKLLGRPASRCFDTNYYGFGPMNMEGINLEYPQTIKELTKTQVKFALIKLAQYFIESKLTRENFKEFATKCVNAKSGEAAAVFDTAWQEAEARRLAIEREKELVKAELIQEKKSLDPQSFRGQRLDETIKDDHDIKELAMLRIYHRKLWVLEQRKREYFVYRDRAGKATEEPAKTTLSRFRERALVSAINAQSEAAVYGIEMYYSTALLHVVPKIQGRRTAQQHPMFKLKEIYLPSFIENLADMLKAKIHHRGELQELGKYLPRVMMAVYDYIETEMKNDDGKKAESDLVKEAGRLMVVGINLLRIRSFKAPFDLKYLDTIQTLSDNSVQDLSRLHQKRQHHRNRSSAPLSNGELNGMGNGLSPESLPFLLETFAEQAEQRLGGPAAKDGSQQKEQAEGQINLLIEIMDSGMPANATLPFNMADLKFGYEDRLYNATRDHVAKMCRHAFSSLFNGVH